MEAPPVILTPFSVNTPVLLTPLLVNTLVILTPLLVNTPVILTPLLVNTPVILTPILVNIPDYLDNSHSILNNSRVRHINNVTFAYININSIRNKCGMLADMVAGRIAILLISERKITETFPTSQFQIPLGVLPHTELIAQ